MIGVPFYNFVAGELSPRMRGRSDLDVYKKGLEKCRNFVPEVQGGARFRNGTRHVMHTRRNRPAILVEFQFNDQQAYLLEFTGARTYSERGYIRFYKNQGIIVNANKTITNITQANPAVVTSNSHGYLNGDEVFIFDVVGMTQVNGKTFIVAGVTGNTFQLTDQDGNNVNSTSYTAYSSGGVAQEIVEIQTPFMEEDLFNLDFAQNGDVLYIVGDNYAPRKLTRSSHTSWAMTTFIRTADPFTSQKTITGLTQANPAVVTSVAHGYANGDEIFIEDVGGMSEINSYVYIIANVTANTFELQDVDGNNINSTAFTAYTSGGYASKTSLLPKRIAFYESRTVYANTGDQPSTFFGSRTPTASATRFDDFTTGTDDDHSFEYTITSQVSNEINPIQWLSGTDRFLAVGTFGGIQKVTGSTAEEAITPTSINVRPIDFDGTESLKPVVLGQGILYMQRGNRILNSLEFDALADAYRPIDKTLVADHILTSGLVQVKFQRGQPDIFWGVRNDGKLVGLTFKPKEDISGWHMQETLTTDDITSIGVMPQTTGYDELWIVTKRTIDGATRYHIEFFVDDIEIPELDDFYSAGVEATDKAVWLRAMFEAQRYLVYMDDSLTYDGSEDNEEDSITLTPVATSGTGITFTASAAFFSASDVGRQLWRKAVEGVGAGRATITGFTSTTQVVCTITETFTSTSAIPAGEWYITTNTVTNLDHLEGETVGVVADGFVLDDEVVADGSVTIANQATVIHVGLKYTGFIKTMNIEAPTTGLLTAGGSTQEQLKNIAKIGIKFLNTSGAQFGRSLYQLEDVSFPASTEQPTWPAPLDSGYRMLEYEDVWSKEKAVYVRQEQPLPCSVQLLVPYLEAAGE